MLNRLTVLLGRPVTDRDVDRPLSDCGLSSRDAVTLVADITRLSGKEVPSTLVWAAPTITALSRALVETTEADDHVPVAATEPIAVVGLACRLPGAPSASAFWSLLRDGECPVATVPPDRWESFAAGQDLSRLPRHGAFLGDVAGFDAAFFGISAREADEMDPQQRLLLEVTWEALANAGMPASSLHGSDCGVFVGLSAVEYGHLTMADLSTVDAWSATGVSASLAANRLSYVLGTHGPSVTVDTACSSSLVAVHQATRALQAGDCSTAVVGGVNLLLSPGITAVFDAAGALSSDGRCKPFDAAADGIVRGEGCGVVVLRRLGDARRAGDRILAVLRGSAVNSDGRSNGIMAPNPRAQAALLRRAYANADLSPGTVDYVEAHGTGTPLGDPIEADALRAVLGANRDAERPLLIGSVKSNLGHLEGAAGITGLIKVVLALRHGQLPPSLHFTQPNPRIDFTGLRVVDAPRSWPRYGGVAR
ncbi:MAG TPA: type I polyketide synthase, partial [Actinophytocola sp.]